MPAPWRACPQSFNHWLKLSEHSGVFPSCLLAFILRALVRCDKEISMNTTRRSFSLAALSAAGLGAAGAPLVQAQSGAWPTRPIKIVAGGVGSVTDIRARW